MRLDAASLNGSNVSTIASACTLPLAIGVQRSMNAQQLNFGSTKLWEGHSTFQWSRLRGDDRVCLSSYLRGLKTIMKMLPIRDCCLIKLRFDKCYK